MNFIMAGCGFEVGDTIEYKTRSEHFIGKIIELSTGIGMSLTIEKILRRETLSPLTDVGRNIFIINADSISLYKGDEEWGAW